MKLAELEKQLRKFGWRLIRNGSRHDIWGNGEESEAVPRHKEIDEYLAKKIIKTARESPKKGG